MVRKHTYDYEYEASLNFIAIHRCFAGVVSFVFGLYSLKDKCYARACSRFLYMDSANCKISPLFIDELKNKYKFGSTERHFEYCV
jgi:hypothetical protein